MRCALDLMQRASVVKPSDLKRQLSMSQRKNVRLILPMLVLAVAFINNSPNGSANHISVENLASDFKQTRSSAVHVVRRAFL